MLTFFFCRDDDDSANEAVLELKLRVPMHLSTTPCHFPHSQERPFGLKPSPLALEGALGESPELEDLEAADGGDGEGDAEAGRAPHRLTRLFPQVTRPHRLQLKERRYHKAHMAFEDVGGVAEEEVSQDQRSAPPVNVRHLNGPSIQITSVSNALRSAV